MFTFPVIYWNSFLYMKFIWPRQSVRYCMPWFTMKWTFKCHQESIQITKASATRIQCCWSIKHSFYKMLTIFINLHVFYYSFSKMLWQVTYKFHTAVVSVYRTWLWSNSMCACDIARQSEPGKTGYFLQHLPCKCKELLQTYANSKIPLSVYGSWFNT